MTDDHGHLSAQLREALHGAVEMADSVVETESLTLPMQVGKVVSVIIPVEEWGELCSAIREVLDRG